MSSPAPIVTFDENNPSETSIFVSLRGFIEQMAQEPDDDSIRLICADYLEDRGHDVFAQFIREQLARPKMHPTQHNGKEFVQAIRERQQRLRLLLRGTQLQPPLVIHTTDLSGLLVASLGLDNKLWFVSPAASSVGFQIMCLRGFPFTLSAPVPTLLAVCATVRKFIPGLRLITNAIQPRQETRHGRKQFSFWHSSDMRLDEYISNERRDWAAHPVWTLPSVLFDTLKNAPGSSLEGEGIILFETRGEALDAISEGLAALSVEMTDDRPDQIVGL